MPSTHLLQWQDPHIDVLQPSGTNPLAAAQPLPCRCRSRCYGTWGGSCNTAASQRYGGYIPSQHFTEIKT